ncbi:MAG: hypothetical protein CMM02_07595 [Rhodopirellula sp.]|nr:hypothetical protein [Rhodopirellula sp.]
MICTLSGHCKAVKPAWETLTQDYKDSDTLLVTEVDCTSDTGKGLCAELGVQGYPTLKYGDVNALSDYKGGRDLVSIQAHAKTIKMSCSPHRRDVCSTQELEQLDELLSKSKSEVSTLISEQEAIVSAAEEEFKASVASLQEQYNQLVQTKDEKVAQVQKSGLQMMKIVLSSMD